MAKKESIVESPKLKTEIETLLKAVHETNDRVQKVKNGRNEVDISRNEREYWDALSVHQQAYKKYQDCLKK